MSRKNELRYRVAVFCKNYVPEMSYLLHLDSITANNLGKRKVQFWIGKNAISIAKHGINTIKAHSFVLLIINKKNRNDVAIKYNYVFALSLSFMPSNQSCAFLVSG